MLQANGLVKADSMFLIKKGASAVVNDIAFHLKGWIVHAPKWVAYTFVDMRKQTQVTRVP